MTLRARLIVTLLALSAAGLLALAAITYLTQRSYLEARIGEQAAAAEPVVARELDRRQGVRRSVRPPVPPGGLAPGDRHGGRRPPGPAGNDPGSRGPPPGARSAGSAGPPPRPGAFLLPPGTYGERRDARGRVAARVLVSFGEERLPPPALPAGLEPGTLITVGARGDGDVRYRARATEDPLGGSTVVALPLTGVDDALDRLLLVEALVIAGVLLALGGLAWLLVRAGLRPLDRMAATADAIAAGDLSRRVSVPAPRSEVGRLGTAFNAMLERLERAFGQREASERRLRSFLADASHELRTPLASIRGYAEVLRMGAARDPADAERAVERIEGESRRMGLLVEDLLTLARLDETRPAPRAPVPLAGLVRDAAADARAMDPGRPISATIAAEPVVEGVEDQLRQVLANLLGNALAHTPPGTPVEVSLHPAGPGRVEVEVRDHGPGLPEGDPEALFDRFWRAVGGRRRGPAGAGLGLAIVAAVAEAHGGEVSARNVDGGGAAFSVRLPLASPAGG